MLSWVCILISATNECPSKGVPIKPLSPPPLPPLFGLLKAAALQKTIYGRKLRSKSSSGIRPPRAANPTLIN
ncbi:hypothetical protein CASFOL_005286 [Castilleja foliolosa]|uniref:Secreted protein n=1 Tax=Castilleja foliolosa TaxID=1961234 RepID=A0ABD3E306_9LAMI